MWSDPVPAQGFVKDVIMLFIIYIYNEHPPQRESPAEGRGSTHWEGEMLCWSNERISKIIMSL